MTSLESVLHGLKYMSKRSKFIVETKIPDFERYVAKRDEYEKYFRQCNGRAFFIQFMAEGIEDGKAALFLACFDTKEDTDKFFSLCNDSEKEWSEEHSADRMAESLMTTFAEG
jgi:hypothetical protein